MATIGRHNPIREAVASLETYWDGRYTALAALEELLADNDIEFADDNDIESHGDEGRITINLKPRHDLICECCEKRLQTLDSVLVYYWYKMPSGKYEITCYLS